MLTYNVKPWSLKACSKNYPLLIFPLSTATFCQLPFNRFCGIYTSISIQHVYIGTSGFVTCDIAAQGTCGRSFPCPLGMVAPATPVRDVMFATEAYKPACSLGMCFLCIRAEKPIQRLGHLASMCDTLTGDRCISQG